MQKDLERLFINLINKFPYVKRLEKQRDNAVEKLLYLKNKFKYSIYPEGHYYSTIPDVDKIKTYKTRHNGNGISGINLNTDRQLLLFNQLRKYYKDIPFSEKKSESLRYYFINSNYSYGDAIILFSMIRYIKPKRIIEVGSGYTSSVILDTNELFFDSSINCTFIEPYPKLLLSLIKSKDKRKVKIIRKKVQKVNKEFLTLSENDILLIDSTHVSKIGSDVNYLLFDILPKLNKGVYIHFHDIFYPFEYPIDWIKIGLFWNEAYLLRAFLLYNRHFSIEYFNQYMFTFHKPLIKKYMPMVLKNPGGSLWIKKIKNPI